MSAFTLANFHAFSRELTELLNENPTSDSIKIYIKSRISELESWLSNYHLNLSSYSDFFDYLFSDDLQSESVHISKLYSEKKSLIYAPTQVGKTDSIIRVVKDFVSHGVSVVISSDNKKDQMDQLVKRLTSFSKSESIFDNTLIVMVGNNYNFQNFVDEYLHIDNEYKTFIFCCLDNSSQILKVYEKISSLFEEIGIHKLLVIHDEGDIINKSRNVDTIVQSQAESHKQWIKFSSKLANKGISMKRVFVTATPENVIVLHKPGHVWNLPIPSNYIGCKQIEYHSVYNFDNETIIKILKKEFKLRKLEGGIILYCVERNKNDNDDDKANQQSVFNYMNSQNNYKKHCMDAISIYNSDGITVSFRLQKFRKQFIEILINEKIKYVINNNVIVIKKSQLCISDFYKYVQDISCKFILTIGKDLISRGISFVSSKKENPLTATTMIYKPGQSLHQVGLCQAIGRLTGTAQPTLKRRLYSTDDISSEYLKFINNQNLIMERIKENGNKVDIELIEEIVLEKCNRDIDRKNLKINKDFQYWEDSSEESDFSTEDEDRMKKLLNLWWGANTIIGKILRFIYESEVGVSENEIKEFIQENGSNNVKAHYDELIKHDNRKYNLIFERTNNKITKIKNEAKKYIDMIK